jgi:hypothetical protein
MIGVHGYIDVKIFYTFVKHVFLNFELFLEKWALKFQKSANMSYKLFSLQNLFMVIKTMQSFTLI